jgi:hypothetical protein
MHERQSVMKSRTTRLKKKEKSHSLSNIRKNRGNARHVANPSTCFGLEKRSINQACHFENLSSTLHTVFVHIIKACVGLIDKKNSEERKKTSNHVNVRIPQDANNDRNFVLKAGEHPNQTINGNSYPQHPIC